MLIHFIGEGPLNKKKCCPSNEECQILLHQPQQHSNDLSSSSSTFPCKESSKCEKERKNPYYCKDKKNEMSDDKPCQNKNDFNGEYESMTGSLKYVINKTNSKCNNKEFNPIQNEGDTKESSNIDDHHDITSKVDDQNVEKSMNIKHKNVEECSFRETPEGCENPSESDEQPIKTPRKRRPIPLPRKKTIQAKICEK